MKKLILFFLSGFSVVAVYSQTVENIRVEPEGDKILIHYRIGGSLVGDVYNVELECSIDGGPRFQPKTVWGAVGKNIMGDKNNYTITWDVFKDVEEIGNAEFFIKVERAGGAVQKYQEPGPFSQPSEKSKKNEIPANYHKRFINYEYNYWNPIGIRLGTLGNWGYQSYIRAGTDIWGYFSAGITIGPTKRIVNRPNYRLHGFAGVGIEYYDMTAFDFELGLSNVIANRVVIDLGYTYWLGLVFGIGIAF